MIKNFIIAFLCVTSVSIHAQNSTVSPYSYFGIGDLRATNSVENNMMGGLSVYGDSIHINLNNPAAYSKLRWTTYTAGLSRNEYSFKTNSSKESASVSNLDYLSLGFSLGKKVGLGFGIMPYSSVGYNFQSERAPAGQDTIRESFSGSGGINRVYLSLGYEVVKNLSLGVTSNFNFGNQESSSIQAIEGVQLGSFNRVNSRINGFDFNFALNYTPKIDEKHTLFTSVIVNTQANLISRNTRAIGSFSTANGMDVEVIDVDLERQGLARTGVQIPTTTTLGLGYGQDKKWFLGAEYSFQELSKFENELSPSSNLVYQNANTIRFGGYYIPEYTSFTSYLKRIVYRAGAKVSTSGIVVDNKEINDFGITFGIGLPLGQGYNFSNVNIGFELGKRGTKYGDLVEENYFKVNLGLSLTDLDWFVKRRIN
ncbi:membrane protein [Arenibacter certesii]|uniref:Membrane protein n=1 Tax=Arenibacter certesii TaxID=228955 RepID=A0A918MLE5_9FLAO|nr:membrane protein [Arenibacter certesii]GGW34183.1 membrane protein [Arenibacter certesii]